MRTRELVVACFVVFALTVGCGLAWPHLQSSSSAIYSPAVASNDLPTVTRIVRVIDGDTVEIAGGEHVRILNIDTAEMPPRSRCDREQRLALAAKARLGELVASADEIVLSSAGRDRDRYGRQLRLVRIDGQDVGDVLIREGLAQPWRGHRAEWC